METVAANTGSKLFQNTQKYQHWGGKVDTAKQEGVCSSYLLAMKLKIKGLFSNWVWLVITTTLQSSTYLQRQKKKKLAFSFMFCVYVCMWLEFYFILEFLHNCFLLNRVVAVMVVVVVVEVEVVVSIFLSSVCLSILFFVFCCLFCYFFLLFWEGLLTDSGRKGLCIKAEVLAGS